MDIKIFPHVLRGTVTNLQSKSYAHRLLIALALAGNTNFEHIDLSSEDVLATAKAASEFSKEVPRVYCNQSGTTLRMMLPILAALKSKSYITVTPQLANRPIEPLVTAISQNGCSIKKDNLQITIEGKLQGGDFYLPGNISSQFISGLLYALPLCKADSCLYITTEIESKPYVHMTLNVLKYFGISICETKNNNLNGYTTFNIKGGQKYTTPKKINIETDWSNSAFWLTSNFIGNSVTVDNLNLSSLQGDKEILCILEKLKTNSEVKIDLRDIPDLLPALAVAAAYRSTCSISRFVNIKRLRIKESDRVNSTKEMILSLGGNIAVTDDEILIKSLGGLNGGIVNSYDDHRIAMAASIAATFAKKPVTILNAQAVNKSYPRFYEQYQRLGGKIVKL